jgi:ElaB/YqjD/DUF883 family membrane-anchored ribosome-binding protein
MIGERDPRLPIRRAQKRQRTKERARRWQCSSPQTARTGLPALVSSAGDQAKTFASELETMARRNPLGTLAGAVAIGVLIGIMGRRS